MRTGSSGTKPIVIWNEKNHAIDNMATPEVVALDCFLTRIELSGADLVQRLLVALEKLPLLFDGVPTLRPVRIEVSEGVTNINCFKNVPVWLTLH